MSKSNVTATDRRAAKLVRHAMYYLIQSRRIRCRWNEDLRRFANVAILGTTADIEALEILEAIQLPCRHKSAECCWAHREPCIATIHPLFNALADCSKQGVIR